MSEFQKFMLTAYHDSEGNEDAPSYCRVVISKSDAQKIIGRMNLVNEIAKVDPSINSVLYGDGSILARFYHSVTDDESDVPDPEDYADMSNVMMEVGKAVVTWSGHHPASNDRLSTNEIRKYQLKRILKDEDPFAPPSTEELVDGL